MSMYCVRRGSQLKTKHFFFFFQLMWVSIYNTSKGTEVKEQSHHLCAPFIIVSNQCQYIYIFSPFVSHVVHLSCLELCTCFVRPSWLPLYLLWSVWCIVLVIVIRSQITWLRAVSLRWHSVFVVILSLKHRDRKVGSFHWLNAFIGTILWGKNKKKKRRLWWTLLW